MTPPANATAFSVLLLTYNRGDIASRRVSELNQFILDRHEDVRLDVLDNGSRRGLPVDLAMACAGQKRIVLHRLADNLGFGPGFNHLVNETDGEWIVLLSDDVVVYGDFIPKLRTAFEAWPEAVVCKEVVNWRAGWNVFGDTTFSYPQGYFLAMRRSVWFDLGGFDERFVPAGYEDVDLGYRISKEQRTLLSISDIPVRHDCLADERMEKTIKLRALFAKKWGLPNVPERP